MAAKTSKPAAASRKPAKSTRVAKSTARFWLTYPPQRIKAPVIWQLGHQFQLVTSIRQASVTDVVGIVCLEVEGPAAEIAAGVKWLKKQGVSVEPVELSAVES
jgi:ABC-type methionine transport system ATPase subunit